MNYELTHDTIAKQIFQKASIEARTRRKIEKYIRERYEAWQERSARLTQDDIDYITPYLAQVNITKDEEAFIEAERKALIAASRRQRMIVIGVIAILILFLGVAIERWIDANAKTAIADRKTVVADSALSEALKSDSVAKEEAKAAKYSDSLAQLQADTARMEKEKAQIALANFEKATDNIVISVLEDAQQDIYKLRYDEAAEKYRDAYNLGKQRDKVAEGMMELAFFYGESGQQREALDLAQKAAGIKGNMAAQRILNSRGEMHSSGIREALKKLDPVLLDSMKRRFYPKMVDLKGNDRIAPFSIGATEITMWQYSLYCQSSGEDSMKRIKDEIGWGLNGDNPVVEVSWYDAARYANWLSLRKDLTPVYIFSNPQAPNDSIKLDSIISKANGFRLPKEEQWKYAALGNESTIYSGSDDLNEVGWYSKNSGGRTRPVAGKKSNAFGLYDMSGNVWEWCEDFYSGRDYRVIRGGSWDFNAKGAEVSHRDYSDLDRRGNGGGFRLLRTP